MDEELGTIGCIVGVVGIVFLILMIVAGGNWRTEVTYVLSESADISKSVQFEENLRARHWALGLIKGKQPDIQQSLSKYIRSGEKITKLTIITRHTWVDNLLTGVTLFIYSPITVTVKGTVTSLKESSEKSNKDNN